MRSFFFCELALCQVCLILPCLHGKNRYAKFCLPVNVAGPVLWCSGNINVSNICVWRTGLWWLSRVEFLLFRCGCLSVVWWNVAEYLGCQTINRWGEHAKGANVNSAHVINPSDPFRPTPDVLRESCSSVISLSTLFSTRASPNTAAHWRRKQQRERKIPRKGHSPIIFCHICICHPVKEETGVKDYFSEKYHHA